MSEPTTPLLLKPDVVIRDNNSWWKRLLDYEEAKNQILFSLPMIITNVAYYLIPLVSVMFAGHIGEVELAAANLANSWATVTGLSFVLRVLMLNGLRRVRFSFSMFYLTSWLKWLIGDIMWARIWSKTLPNVRNISSSILLFMLAGYVLFTAQFKETWRGFSLESFNYVFVSLKLALPSAAMVCLEYWAFELLVLLAGLFPNSEITTSLIAMCVNTEAIAYMCTYGLSAAASTRVSNELGAKNINKAKHAMGVTLKLSIILALVVVLALGFGHNIWAGFFSDSPVIISSYASMTPLLVISIILDSIQGVLSGVARGCGWQYLAVCINLAMFYFIGMPVAIALAFLLKLYAKGLWIGLICGLSCQTGGLLVLVYIKKWMRVELNDSNDLDNNIIV